MNTPNHDKPARAKAGGNYFSQACCVGECDCEPREMNRDAPRRHLSFTAERDTVLAVREP